MKKLFSIFLLFISSLIVAQPTCQWAYIPVGTSLTQNNIAQVAADKNGNIYELGKFTGHGDMDPSAGLADTSFTPSFYNFYILKTDPIGKLIWIHYFQLNSQLISLEFKALKINAKDELIVAGNFTGKIDFDFSLQGVDTLRNHSPSAPDFFLAKYDSDGNYKWAFNIGSTGTGTGTPLQTISLAPHNKILVSVNPTTVADLDPSGAVHNSIGTSVNLICYDEDGNYVWNSSITPTLTYGVSCNSLDLDSLGNSYVLSVGNYMLTVSKFDSTGLYLWSKRIGDFSIASRVNPQSLLVDKTNGNFYIAGTFEGNVDFDPNSATQTLTSSPGLNADGFLAKYDSSMTPIWINPYAGKINFGNYSLIYDGADIASVGYLEGTINFGNGINLSAAISNSPFYVKFDAAGNALTGFALSGVGRYTNIAASINGKYVMSGYVQNYIDVDPSAATLILNPSGASFFTAVYQFPISTSISNFSAYDTNKLSLFPNPCADFLTINTNIFEENTTLKITDISGRMLYSQAVSSKQASFKLITSTWKSGIYFASLQTKAEVKNIKFIKK